MKRMKINNYVHLINKKQLDSILFQYFSYLLSPIYELRCVINEQKYANLI